MSLFSLKGGSVMSRVKPLVGNSVNSFRLDRLLACDC